MRVNVLREKVITKRQPDTKSWPSLTLKHDPTLASPPGTRYVPSASERGYPYASNNYLKPQHQVLYQHTFVQGQFIIRCCQAGRGASAPGQATEPSTSKFNLYDDHFQVCSSGKRGEYLYWQNITFQCHKYTNVKVLIKRPL